MFVTVQCLMLLSITHMYICMHSYLFQFYFESLLVTRLMETYVCSYLGRAWQTGVSPRYKILMPSLDYIQRLPRDTSNLLLLRFGHFIQQIFFSLHPFRTCPYHFYSFFSAGTFISFSTTHMLNVILYHVPLHSLPPLRPKTTSFFDVSFEDTACLIHFRHNSFTQFMAKIKASSS